jgi:hypothetical protein
MLRRAAGLDDGLDRATLGLGWSASNFTYPFGQAYVQPPDRGL